MKDSQSPPRMPPNGQPEAEPSAAWWAAADPETVWRVCHALTGQCERCPSSEPFRGREDCTRGCYMQAVECVNIVETGNPWRKTSDVKPPWVVLLPTPPSEPGWQPISSAPRDGTEVVAITAGGAALKMKWNDTAAVSADDDICGCWVAAEEGQHPRCWTDGICWAPNEDEEPSDPPRWWTPPPVEAASPAHAELSPGNSSDLRGEEG